MRAIERTDSRRRAGQGRLNDEDPNSQEISADVRWREVAEATARGPGSGRSQLLSGNSPARERSGAGHAGVGAQQRPRRVGRRRPEVRRGARVWKFRFYMVEKRGAGKSWPLIQHRTHERFFADVATPVGGAFHRLSYSKLVAGARPCARRAITSNGVDYESTIIEKIYFLYLFIYGVS